MAFTYNEIVQAKQETTSHFLRLAEKPPQPEPQPWQREKVAVTLHTSLHLAREKLHSLINEPVRVMIYRDLIRTGYQLVFNPESLKTSVSSGKRFLALLLFLQTYTRPAPSQRKHLEASTTYFTSIEEETVPNEPAAKINQTVTGLEKAPLTLIRALELMADNVSDPQTETGTFTFLSAFPENSLGLAEILAQNTTNLYYCAHLLEIINNLSLANDPRFKVLIGTLTYRSYHAKGLAQTRWQHNPTIKRIDETYCFPPVADKRKQLSTAAIEPALAAWQRKIFTRERAAKAVSDKPTLVNAVSHLLSTAQPAEEAVKKFRQERAAWEQQKKQARQADKQLVQELADIWRHWFTKLEFPPAHASTEFVKQIQTLLLSFAPVDYQLQETPRHLSPKARSATSAIIYQSQIEAHAAQLAADPLFSWMQNLNDPAFAKTVKYFASHHPAEFYLFFKSMFHQAANLGILTNEIPFTLAPDFGARAAENVDQFEKLIDALALPVAPPSLYDTYKLLSFKPLTKSASESYPAAKTREVFTQKRLAAAIGLAAIAGFSCFLLFNLQRVTEARSSPLPTAILPISTPTSTETPPPTATPEPTATPSPIPEPVVIGQEHVIAPEQVFLRGKDVEIVYAFGKITPLSTTKKIADGSYLGFFPTAATSADTTINSYQAVGITGEHSPNTEINLNATGNSYLFEPTDKKTFIAPFPFAITQVAWEPKSLKPVILSSVEIRFSENSPPTSLKLVVTEQDYQAFSERIWQMPEFKTQPYSINPETLKAISAQILPKLEPDPVLHEFYQNFINDLLRATEDNNRDEMSRIMLNYTSLFGKIVDDYRFYHGEEMPGDVSFIDMAKYRERGFNCGMAARIFEQLIVSVGGRVLNESGSHATIIENVALKTGSHGHNILPLPNGQVFVIDMTPKWKNRSSDIQFTSPAPKPNLSERDLVRKKQRPANVAPSFNERMAQLIRSKNGNLNAINQNQSIYTFPAVDAAAAIPSWERKINIASTPIIIPTSTSVVSPTPTATATSEQTPVSIATETHSQAPTTESPPSTTVSSQENLSERTALPIVPLVSLFGVSLAAAAGLFAVAAQRKKNLVPSGVQPSVPVFIAAPSTTPTASIIPPNEVIAEKLQTKLNQQPIKPTITDGLKWAKANAAQLAALGIKIPDVFNINPLQLKETRLQYYLQDAKRLPTQEEIQTDQINLMCFLIINSLMEGVQ